MKADITRSTYNKNKKYAKVNAQQGRVQLDADWNEQLDIQEHFNKTMLCDIVGKTGTPLENPGFEIVPNSNNIGFTIGKGRYYVNGIICENDSDELDAQKQEDLPYSELFEENSIFPKTNKSEDYFIVYLNVWQRHITFLEDPDLLEVALGRIDTTTRTKNVWQVKTLPVNGTGDVQKALEVFENKLPRSTGKLRVRTKPAPVQGRCESINTSGYSGDTNRLYRVEIHSSGTIDSKKNSTTVSPVFKWSRENAFVAAKIYEVERDLTDENKLCIVIENNGKDDLTTFRAGQWIEVTDDYYELWNIPGIILKIDAAENYFQENQSRLKVTVPSTNNNQHKLLDYIAVDANKGYVSVNAKVRRWNTPEDKWSMFSDYYTKNLSPKPSDNDVELDPNTSPDPKSVSDTKNIQPDQDIECVADKEGYIDLEDGIQIKFEVGTYKTGDYWLIPARTTTKNIEWPTDTTQPDTKTPAALPSMMEHNYCPLALLKYSKNNNNESKLEVVSDYRNFFSTATTNALNFYYESGDDQKITLDNVYFNANSPGTPLKLCVRAEIGNKPITLSDKFVRFKIVNENYGVCRLVGLNSDGLTSKTVPAASVDVSFVEGVACCGLVISPSSKWEKAQDNSVELNKNLDMITPDKQYVSATLMQRTGPTNKDVIPWQVAQVLFSATFAQPELCYESGDGQIVLKDEKSVNVPFDLKVRVEVAGKPLCSASNYLRIWKVEVRFTQTVGEGTFNRFNSVCYDPGEDGLVSHSWKFVSSPLYQQVKAELVDSATSGRKFVGSALLFHATLPQLPVTVQQTAITATSGVIELKFKNELTSTGPMISENVISHSINGDVPPAIILSLLPFDAHLTTAINEKVESFEDFALYNWANASSNDKNTVYPRFKAVDVNKNSFKILVEPPFPKSDQIWHLRWWAIPARNTSNQKVTFKSCILQKEL
ncbi:MAG: DUF6519 domain-containing protein [Candidatus Bathyarchaeota archaeon]|nr:DUF6519 domain-containing protein [Candidatus Termiticorpusculum sp.]